MDIELPDGRVLKGIPEGTTKAQIIAKLKANGHDTSKLEGPPVDAASQIPGQRSTSAPAIDAPTSWLDRLRGTVETGATLATAIPAGVIGSVAGIGQGLFGGKYGTPEGAREAEATMGKVADYFTYHPRGQAGQEMTGTVGKVFNELGPATMALPELNMLGRAAAPVAQMAGDIVARGGAAVGESGANALARLRPAPAPMAGMGAAETSAALQRAVRANDLPVPIKLTEGQATRTFGAQKFEKETAKLPEGEPLRQRFAEQNQQLLQNFDAFTESTGAQKTSLRAVGEVVNDAVVKKFEAAKQKVNQAYKDAREAGHMADEVDTVPILQYIEDNRPASLNAPVLNSVEAAIKKLDPQGTGKIALNDIEEIRKMAGRLSTPGTPNMVYGIEVKKMIDGLTENKGGELYKQARRMNENFSNEFANTGVIDKLLSKKPGTNDRAVAYEDVFNHSILSGSLDDVRAVRRTLQTAGPEGQQAWKELQGATVNNIKETITKNVARDVNGNPIVSPAELNKMVRALDQDGKLDFIFGKKGAEQIREVNSIAQDVLTAPPGSVNTSNTASVLIGLLDTAVSGTAGLPLPIGSAINYGVKKVKSNALSKKVEGSLNYNALSR